MEAKTELEQRELLKLDNRFIMLCYSLRAYTDTPKVEKQLSKAVAIERKNVLSANSPINRADLNAVIWRYDDLVKIAAELKKNTDASVFGKACADLDDLIKKAEAEIDVLRENLSGSKSEKTVKEFADKIADGARHVGEKVSGAVNGAVDKLKKLIQNDAE